MEKYYLYIVLTRTSTVVSRLIRFFMKDEYTHAAISLDKELENMYSFGRKNAYNPFIGGFNQEYLNKGVYKFCKILPGVIMEVEVSKQQYEKAKVLLDLFISNPKHYKYNYKGLLNSLFNQEASCDDRFLCSEFVYYILNNSGIVDFEISRNLVRPQNLLNLNSKMTYKGNLKELKLQNNNLNSKEKNIIALSTIYE